MSRVSTSSIAPDRLPGLCRRRTAKSWGTSIACAVFVARQRIDACVRDLWGILRIGHASTAVVWGQALHSHRIVLQRASLTRSAVSRAPLQHSTIEPRLCSSTPDLARLSRRQGTLHPARARKRGEAVVKSSVSRDDPPFLLLPSLRDSGPPPRSIERFHFLLIHHALSMSSSAFRKGLGGVAHLWTRSAILTGAPHVWSRALHTPQTADNSSGRGETLLTSSQKSGF